MGKQRVDTLLVDRGLVESREKAQALVMAGQVSVAGHTVYRPALRVEEGVMLRLTAPSRYVSRGGGKLEHALGVFGLDVLGLVAIDIGSSTGGFTDCLLQHGASKVYAVDVGKGQLDYRLRNDPRVVVMEGVNARHLKALPQPADIVTIDVSFISLRLVLPPAKGLFDAGRGGAASGVDTGANGSIVALFKPQFEAGKGEVPRGGVVRDEQHHAVLIGRFAAWCVANGFRILDMVSSPLLGSSGNREFLFWLRPDRGGAVT